MIWLNHFVLLWIVSHGFIFSSVVRILMWNSQWCFQLSMFSFINCLVLRNITLLKWPSFSSFLPFKDQSWTKLETPGTKLYQLLTLFLSRSGNYLACQCYFTLKLLWLHRPCISVKICFFGYYYCFYAATSVELSLVSVICQFMM